MTGWMGGWGIVAADVIVMASLAQIAGQYVFLLFGADGLAVEQVAGVPAVGVPVDRPADLRSATAASRCRRGCSSSCSPSRSSSSSFFAVVALVKVYPGHAARRRSTVAVLVQPVPHHRAGARPRSSLLLAVFIYWGWDTAVSVNEETKDPDQDTGPGGGHLDGHPAGHLRDRDRSRRMAFAGAGAGWLATRTTRRRVLGASATHGARRHALDKILIIAVLTSAAASTQTTILPTARTTLSMAAYQAIPASFAEIHPRYLTPTLSTIGMGAGVDRLLRRLLTAI